MKAAILEKVDSPLVIKDVTLTPLKEGQVLVKILLSGICGSQVHDIHGWKGNEKFMPHMLGHEGAGIVEAVGPSVRTVEPGDKVVMHWREGEGLESPHPTYLMDGKEITSGKITTLSEYSIVSENRITKVPDNTPDDLCALLGCGLTTALGVIDNEINIKLGETVMVLGCGGVGLNLIQGSLLAGAGNVIGVDVIEEKREKVELLGGTFEIVSDNDYRDLKKWNANIIIDTTGNMEALHNTFDILADGGQYILVGQFSPEETLTIPNAMKLFSGNNGKTIKASQGGQVNPTKDLQRYIDLYNAGHLNIEDIVTHTFKLEDINLAFETLRSGKAGRIMIKP